MEFCTMHKKLLPMKHMPERSTYTYPPSELKTKCLDFDATAYTQIHTKAVNSNHRHFLDIEPSFSFTKCLECSVCFAPSRIHSFCNGCCRMCQYVWLRITKCLNIYGCLEKKGLHLLKITLLRNSLLYLFLHDGN
jgi:hypothetical protein